MELEQNIKQPTTIYIKRKEYDYILDSLLENRRTASNLIGIDGRRRVGKTTFVNEYIKEKVKKNDNVIYFSFIGNNTLSLRENVLQCFNKIKYQLIQIIEKHNIENDNLFDLLKAKKIYAWVDFFLYFEMIYDVLNKLGFYIYVFFDEISWYDKHNKFISFFANSWNSKFSLSENVTIFLASSVNTWMDKNIFENTTTLFGRLNLKIKLEPFSLVEIIEYFKIKTNSYNFSDKSKKEIMQYYLMFGGIIKYYDWIDFSMSYEDNIERLSKINIFENEYNILFKGLFSKNNEENILIYKKIVSILCRKKKASFDEIYKEMKDKNKNTIYRILNELTASNLIKTTNFNKNNTYMINDLFCFFYYTWMSGVEIIINDSKIKSEYEAETKDNKPLTMIVDVVQMKKQNNYYNTWSGFAFEIMMSINKNISLITDIKNDKMILNWKRINKTEDKLKIKFKNKSKQIDLLLISKLKNTNKFKIVELKNYKDNYSFTEEQVVNLYEKADELIQQYGNDIIIEILIVSFYKINLPDYEFDDDSAAYKRIKIKTYSLLDFL